MSTPASLSGLPLAVNEDVLNANASFGNYAKGADTLLIPRYATAAARDAAGAAGTTEGQMCVTDRVMQQYDGSRWWHMDAGSTTLMTLGTVNAKPGTAVFTTTIKAGARYDLESMTYASCTVTTSDLVVSFTQDAQVPAFDRNVYGPTGAAPTANSAMSMVCVSGSNQYTTGVIVGSLVGRWERATILGGTTDGIITMFVGVGTVGTAITIDPNSWVKIRRTG